jgi:DNA-binding PadR family transcriptional regulator
MSEIEKRTDGQWRPSPGSIYPLLAWLQEKGYYEELSQQESGVKRYTLTERGKSFLEEHLKRKKELRIKIGFLHPRLLDRGGSTSTQKNAVGLLNQGRNSKSSWKLLDNRRQEYSEKAVAQATGILDNAAQKD